MNINKENYDTTINNINHSLNQLKSLNESFDEVLTTLNTTLLNHVKSVNETIKNVTNQINQLQNEVNEL